MVRTTDVVIVGGGVNGAAIAFYLAQRGVGVTLLEKDSIGTGPTGRSCGIIRQHYSHEVTARMAKRGLEVFQNFDDLVGGECDFRQTGMLFVAREEDLPVLEGNVALQQSVGVRTRMVSPEEIREIEPGITLDGIAAGAWEEDAGHADPYSTTTSYAARATELGADVRTGTTVISIEAENGRVTGVATETDRIHSAAVVVAAGPWTRLLMERCGVDVPLVAGRVQVGLFDLAPEFKNRCIFADTNLGIYTRPEGDDLMLVGSIQTVKPEAYVDDPDHYNEGLDFDRMSLYSEKLVERYPAMNEGKFHNGYASLYDISPDWQPILDEMPGVSGLYCAAGSSGHGFKLAPVVGEMVAQLVLEGRTPDDDLDTFAFDRFEAGVSAGGKYRHKILG